MYNKDPLLIKSFLADNDNPNKLTKFIDNDKDDTYISKIDEWLFLKLGFSTETKLYILREIFEKFDISLDDLSFYIK